MLTRGVSSRNSWLKGERCLPPNVFVKRYRKEMYYLELKYHGMQTWISSSCLVVACNLRDIEKITDIKALKLE